LVFVVASLNACLQKPITTARQDTAHETVIGIVTVPVIAGVDTLLDKPIATDRYVTGA
tara:strand:- start:4 stop:177 length:174 start_codon:yes stop_codon:yes gene_type:complete